MDDRDKEAIRAIGLAGASKYFAAPEDFGAFTCAEDFNESQRMKQFGWEPITEEMP